MKGLGLFAIAALFSATAVAQVNTEDRDLQNRREPVKTEMETKSKTKSDVSKADEDLKDKQDVSKTKTKTVTKSETSSLDGSAAGATEDNTICCGKEKDNGFMGIWKFNVQNSEKEDKVAKQYKSKEEVETETGATSTESDLDVSTESDLYNHDTRMDAGGRTESDLELKESDMELNRSDDALITPESDLESSGELEKSEGVKDSGARCPAGDQKEGESLEDHERMHNDNSPKF